MLRIQHDHVTSEFKRTWNKSPSNKESLNASRNLLEVYFIVLLILLILYGMGLYRTNEQHYHYVMLQRVWADVAILEWWAFLAFLPFIPCSLCSQREHAFIFFLCIFLFPWVVYHIFSSSEGFKFQVIQGFVLDGLGRAPCEYDSHFPHSLKHPALPKIWSASTCLMVVKQCLWKGYIFLCKPILW